MKGLFYIFKSSAGELKQIRTITTTGMLMAIAIALRSFAIDITQDVRISFAFIAIMAIAILYGPVVAGIANVSMDFLGYVISNHTTREYSIPLALVTVLSGVIYGLICYNAKADESEKYRITPKKTVFICISRVVVVFLNHICLNSLIIYSSYVNKDFNLFSPESYNTEFWLWMSPRIVKNIGEVVADMVLIPLIIPVIIMSYDKVRSMYSSRRKSA